MAIICPTILAEDAHAYREQYERIEDFAKRIQIDLTDGDFAETKTLPLEQLWWNDSDKIDLHLMYRDPSSRIDDLIRLNPHLVIVHAEADGQFIEMAQLLHLHDIKAGVALLKDTTPDKIRPALEYIDHVLIFSGDLGKFGGQADLALLDKVHILKSWKPEIEIGWDGGVNDRNAAALADGGVDVLNAGGFIQKSDSPKKAYAKLKVLVEKQR
jgi:ribulose-phosphate 3-epimerase